MKKKAFLFILLLFCLPLLSFSQSSIPEFGVYNDEELAMKVCTFDKEADAVILLDEATSGYDDDYHLVTTRRVRIKILNDRAIDRANIRIPFYSKDEFETISDIKAMSYTSTGNGDPVISSVGKKSIFSEKENDLFSSIKFAIPNVNAGSIIEYKYRSVMKNYGGLREWKFQSDLPTCRSCYNLEILPGCEFAYQVQKAHDYPIVIEPKNHLGQIYYEMDNIPGLRFEPYMDAVKDYLQKVEFQLSAYVNYFGSTNKVNQTWRDLAYDLYIDKDFCGALRNNYPEFDELKQLVMQQKTGAEKINSIYDFVKTRFTWNGFDGKYALGGLKKIWDQRSGDAGEINLLLVNLLQLFDIEAYPMLVAERDFGKIDMKYPFRDRFNKTVAYAIADSNMFVLDATQKYTPAGLTPYTLLNTIAFLVDKKKYQLFAIDSKGEKYDNLIRIQARLSDKGMLSGRAEVSSQQYARQVCMEKISKNKEGFIKETYANSHEGMAIDSFFYNKPGDLTEPLTQVITFHNEFNENGGFILLNYNLFTGLSRNPFTSDIRFTNINFGFPYDIKLQEEIEVPANSTVDEVPKDKKITTPNKDISILREITREGNILKIAISFRQTTTLFLSNDYPLLKQFYKLMVEMLNEPIVVKLGK